MRDGFTGKADQIRKLQQEGYAPLMRFGQYIVDVAKFDENGEPVIGDDGNPDRPFFGMFETEAEAKEAAEILAEEYLTTPFRAALLRSTRTRCSMA